MLHGIAPKHIQIIHKHVLFMSGTTILVPSWKKSNVYLKEIEVGHRSSFGLPQTESLIRRNISKTFAMEAP